MCTDLRLVNEQNRHISGRNLDYSGDLETWISAVPAGARFVSIVPPLCGRSGFDWVVEYDYIGFISLPKKIKLFSTATVFNELGSEHKAMSNEAMNEKGLSVASLWNDDCQYLKEESWPAGLKAMADFSIVEWIAGSFASVQDLKKTLLPPDLLGAPLPQPASPPFVIWGNLTAGGYNWTPAPAHYVVHDASGDNLVLEVIDGVLTLLESPPCVLTNEPRLSWQMENLGNYAHLSYVDPAKSAFGGGAVPPIGCGAGMLGLPGDYTPPSRFAKIALLNWSGADYPLDDATNPRKPVTHAFNLLSAVAPPYGFNQTPDGNDFTQWQAVRDHRECAYYIRTCFGTATQVIKVKEVDFKTDTQPRYRELSHVNAEVHLPLPA